MLFLLQMCDSGEYNDYQSTNMTCAKAPAASLTVKLTLDTLDCPAQWERRNMKKADVQPDPVILNSCTCHTLAFWYLPNTILEWWVTTLILKVSREGNLQWVLYQPSIFTTHFSDNSHDSEFVMLQLKPIIFLLWRGRVHLLYFFCLEEILVEGLMVPSAFNHVSSQHMHMLSSLLQML